MMLTMQVANLSELLREVQMLRVTREVQAVISAANPDGGGAAAGVATIAFQPASQQLQTLENLMKHNDRCLLCCFRHASNWHCLRDWAEVGGLTQGEHVMITCYTCWNSHDYV